MLRCSYVSAGNLLTIIFIAVALLAGLHLNESTRNHIRMSHAFQVDQKPYTPAPKPKPKGKEKFRDQMARVIWSGMGITAGSGKMQGTVLQSNNIIRVKRKPNNVRNSFTQYVRGVFSGQSTAWRSLTPTEILTWTTAAPLYFSKKVLAVAHQLKGNTLFQRVNNILTSLGITNVTSAPAVAVPVYTIVSVAPAASAGGATFTAAITEFAAQTVLPATGYMKVYATRQVGAGRSSFGKSAYRLIGIYPPTTSTNPLDIHADYVARFGAPAEGNRIGIAMEVITFGGSPPEFAQSGKFYSQVIVAA